MKKLFIFLAICVLSLTGFFFACNNDKYADLKITVGSVSLVSGSGEKLEQKSSGNLKYYEVNYGETFSVEGIVKCSSDMSKRIIFDSINDSIYKLPSQTETDNGSIAVFKANQPSYGDNYFRIKLSSVETPRKASYVNIKVVLPVQEISLQDNLVVTLNNNVNLFDHINYISSHPDSGFMTTQKGVNFKVLNFSYINGEEIKTVDYTKEFSLENPGYVSKSGNVTVYGVKVNDKDVGVFKIYDGGLKSGNIEVINSNYAGTISVEAKSTEFDEEIFSQEEEIDLLKTKEESELTASEILKIEAFDKNEKLRKIANINLVEGLNYSNFSFVGGQTGFEPIPTGFNDVPKSKLNSSLYINSLADYEMDEKTYYYLFEQVDFILNSKAKVSVSAREVDISKQDEDGNYLQTFTGIINPVVSSDYTSSDNSYQYTGNIKFNSTGKTGEAYYDLIFTYSDFSNEVSFSFSKMYQEFLSSLSTLEEANVDKENKCFYFETSAIASNIAIYQDGSIIDFEDISVETPAINIYDDYDAGFNNGYGTKISLNLTLAQNVVSSRIKNENKQVKVKILSSSNLDVRDYIEIRYFNGSLITLQKDEANNYYFIINLAGNNANYFYAKAKNNYSEFTFEFENLLQSTISVYSSSGTFATSLKNVVQRINVYAVKGVNSIGVFAINNKEGLEGNNRFEEVDFNNLTANELFQTVIVKYVPFEPQYSYGAVLGILVNENTSDNLSILPLDEEIVKIFDLETSYNEIFADLNYEGKTFLRAFSVVGLKLGQTTIDVVAGNGYKVSFMVKVVNSLLEDESKSFKLSVNQGYGKNVVTQSNLNNTSLISNVLDQSGSLEYKQNVRSDSKISAKVRGNFLINYTVKPDLTSLKSVKFVVKDENGNVVVNNVKVNNASGVVTTNAVGIYYVYVEFTYYTFDVAFTNNNQVNEFSNWGEKTVIKAFKLEVYEPVTSIKLDKYVANVYDYNSLGVDYKRESTVEVRVTISPINASILSDSSAIRYYVDANSRVLSGSNGTYTARLNELQTSATEYIYVKINEYGTEYTLVCTVNVVKAVQVKEIGVTIFDGNTKKENKEFSLDPETIYVATKLGKDLRINTTINPLPNSVHNDDLIVRIYEPNNDGTIYLNSPKVFNEENCLATLSYYGQQGESDGQSVVLNNGQDFFNVLINNSKSGKFYIVIYSSDSMTSEITGKVYKKILVDITDGTQANPYVIETISDLIEINENPTKHYVLGSDINLSSIANWSPLVPEGFTGSLNGYNANISGNNNQNEENVGKFFKISGLKIIEINTKSSNNNPNIGLFSKISARVEGSIFYYGAILNLALEVDNISLVNKEFNGSEDYDEVNIGCLAGVNEGGLIMNCSVKVENYNVRITNRNANVGGAVGLSRSGHYDSESIRENPCIANFPSLNLSNGSQEHFLLKTSSYKLSYASSYNNSAYQSTTKYAIANGEVCERSTIDDMFISTNPYNVKMNVGDSQDYSVCAGGIVGKLESGVINGIYGTYDYIERQNSNSVNYLTTYQSQGFDVNVNLNSDPNSEIAKIVNIKTKLGGVVGELLNNGEEGKAYLSHFGSVYNISSCGQIGYYVNTNDGIKIGGALVNVGGIAGYVKADLPSNLDIKNTLSSVKLRANGQVGGAFGSINFTEINESSSIELIRVENYEEKQIGNVDDNPNVSLIILGPSLHADISDESSVYRSAGGVVGYADAVNLSLVYSDSFVRTFNDGYKTYGDIYSSLSRTRNGDCAGGIVGFVGFDVRVDRAFSKFNIMAEGIKVGGISGEVFSEESEGRGGEISISNIYYIGVLDGNNLEVLTGNNKNPFGEDVLLDGDYYYYYYLLGYDVDDSEYLKSVKVYEGDDNKDKTYWSNTDNCGLSFSYKTDVGETIEVEKPVLLRSNETDNEEYFIKSVPESISVEPNSNVERFDNNSIEYTNAKVMSFVDGEDNLCIILKRSYFEDGQMSLDEIFNIVPTPNIIGRFSVVVRCYVGNNERTDIVYITNDGKIIFDDLSVSSPIYLELYVKENITASQVVKLFIIENFDELFVSNSPTYAKNMFDYSSDNPAKVRKNTETNTFEFLGEKLPTGKTTNNVVSQFNEENFVGIDNVTGYSYIYEIEKYNSNSGVYEETDDYSKVGASLIFNNSGKYQVTVKVQLVLDGVTLELAKDGWMYYYEVYSGAINVSFNTDEIWMQSNQTYSDLVLTLKTDVEIVGETFPELAFEVLKNEQGNLTAIDPQYNQESSYLYEFKAENLKVGVSKDACQVDLYSYNFTISVLNKIDITKPVYYTIKAYDKECVLFKEAATVNIVLVPQGISGINAVHYRYTQSVSKIVNTVNTEEFDNETTTYAYSFTNEPKNTVVAGSEGLFVVDLYPYYANITSVSIESSLGELSGNALQFVQLVRVGGVDGGYKYVYAPTAISTGTSGIYLGLYSDACKERNGTVTLADISDFASNENTRFIYTFEGLDDGSEMGRLYIKTIAPTNLEVEESFIVTVKVKFMALDENDEYVEQEYVYEHTLVVESVSGYSFSMTHNDEERNKIAYTGIDYAGENSGADWLDLKLNVDDSYTSANWNVREYITIDGDKFEINDDSDYAKKISVGNNKSRLVLGRSAQVGGTIKIEVILGVEYEGYLEERSFYYFINIVDLIIEDVSIVGVSDVANEKIMYITVSTSKQLKVEIKGFGTTTAIENAENRISRLVNSNYNSIYYWYASPSNSNKHYVNLDSADIKNLLPFNINKVLISNEEINLKINSVNIYNALEKIIVLEGSTSEGSVDMMFSFSYLYLDGSTYYSDGNSKGKIAFVPNEFNGAKTISKYFKVVVREDSNEDHPKPIFTVDDLISMGSATGGNYILMNDLEIDNHTALNAKFNSFDGNNKIITINSFAYSTNLVSSNENYSINLGLFDTVDQNVIIKNVIVALPTRSSNASMNLGCYSTINFGGIAAINNGIITNCDVISVSNDLDLVNYFDMSEVPYTVNIETSDYIGQTEVKANVGLFVGVNNANGVITNSRVGREKVDVLTVYDSQATVVYKNEYSKTSPIMLAKVFGKANVGGFVSQNSGVISSSFAKNLQLENISKSAKGFAKTAGFVVSNSGFVYGSFACGWEEESMKNISVNSDVSSNRKLGGGLFSNGSIAGFVYSNLNYIEDCYSNINCSGDLTFVANSFYVNSLKMMGSNDWSAPAAAGFVYITRENSYITTSYSLSKIELDTVVSRPNTFGAFEGRMESPDSEFFTSGTIENCYFMMERKENFSYDHERAIKLTDDPAISLDDEEEETIGINEFVNKKCFNNFSFDNSFDNANGFDLNNNISKGGVWAIYSNGTEGYPELISANTIAISCRVINVTKTNNSESNTYYYTYVDGYELGSYLNPYTVSNFSQYNNIFKDVVGNQTFNDEVTTKFTGNIRLVNNINFENSERVYSTEIEYTSNVNVTSIFDGNYLSLYNVTLSNESENRSSFGLFKDVYYASVKNLKIVVDKVSSANTISVGALAGAIVNSNIYNITLVSAQSGIDNVVKGNNYVGGLAGIIISSDDGNVYSVANIKSNLPVVGNTSSPEVVNAITTSGYIWERIKPMNNANGLSAISSNIRLHNLPVNVNYAGGIAGVVDIKQKKEIEGTVELIDPNVTNIHVGEIRTSLSLESNLVVYNNDYRIKSDYAGGLFGLIGGQTYLERADLIVGSENNMHYISANQIAGGIAAVNFGKISQSYVSFSQTATTDLDKEIKNYVEQDATAQVHPNKTFFAEGSPKYIGGIVGINVGNGDNGSGTILNCYNRVDVKNANAIGVGGIAGGSYIGVISNVYTTASLMGKLFANDNSSVAINSETRIGAIVGNIFRNGDSGYFADYNLNSDKKVNTLTLQNIVALNVWDSEDFDLYYDFDEYHGKVGAIYGYYDNGTENNRGIVRLGSNIFVQNYMLKDFTDPYISSVDLDKIFSIDSLTQQESFIELWGVGKSGGPNFDEYINSILGEVSNAIITPNKYKALYSGTEIGVSGLRLEYFPVSDWLRTIWNYDDDILLPILKFGYESSIIRIYTASEFIEELSKGNSTGKLYVIMNDIDFSGYVFGTSENSANYVNIDTAFRGQLYGNNVTYEDSGTKYTRKPILFNLEFGNEGTKKFDGYSGIFEKSIGATFANFNIVVKSYKGEFGGNEIETVASVLVANSVNTSINNVHIYSSLLDNVNKEVYPTNYEFANESISERNARVCDGHSLDSNKRITDYKPYLKLAVCKIVQGVNVIETEFNSNPENRYYFTYSEPENEFQFKYSPNSSFSGNVCSIQVYKCAEGNIENCFNINNVRTVGLLTGIGSMPYISNCSVNIDVRASFKSTGNIEICIGKIAGRMVGQLNRVLASGKLIVTNTANEANNRYDGVAELCVGHLVGKIEGSMLFCFIKNASLEIGETPDGNINRSIVSQGGNAGLYIGGMFGKVSEYHTINDSTVGGASNMYAFDSSIVAYVDGVAKIGGIIGSNGYSVQEVRYTNNLTLNQKIMAYSYSSSTILTIGGIVAENSYSRLQNVYSNLDIEVIPHKESEIRVGGIVGRSITNISFEKVVNDSKEISIHGNDNQDKLLCVEYVGGLIASAEAGKEGGNMNVDVTLENVISTANIVSVQGSKMYVGGMIGNVKGDVYIDNGICLGNITLEKINKYTVKNKNGQEVESKFNTDDEYIGGLIGNCDRLPQQKNGDQNFIVLSTIRDYAIGQKAGEKLNIGPVVGRNWNASSGTINLYYNENISLVSNNGYGEYFRNLNQTDKRFEENFLEILGNFEEDFLDEENSNLFGLENYIIRTVDPENEDEQIIEFVAGTKINPIVYNGQLSANKYYILTSDIQISNSITGMGNNCVINAQGYSFYTNIEENKKVFKGNYSIFNEISEGSAVVGLIEDVNVGTSFTGAIITATNNGFIFACGVGGKIEGGSIASLVKDNNSVLSASFSITDLKVKSGFGSGLVATNKGSILNCYYTGTITQSAARPTVGNLSGICNSNFSNDSNNSYEGAISNCYTMADIDTTNFSGGTKATVYPICVVQEDKKNLYKCYYDYAAYVGGNEGKSNEEAKAEDISYITSNGIYVWSSALSDTLVNKGIETSDDIKQTLEGCWSESKGLVNMFKSTDEYLRQLNSNEPYGDDLILDSSWFNYGYLTLDYMNNIINLTPEVFDDNDDNVMRYLQLLYTGNGLANKDGQIWNDNGEKVDATPGENCGFKDYPYMIKHGGILDVIINANNTTTGVDYRYYLITHNIDLIKYTKITYWVYNWDSKEICFAGDLDGNNKTIINMYSSYGLLRMIVGVEQLVSHVYRVTFEKCYSKTGVVAGGMTNGILDNVIIKNCIVYNGDLNRCKGNNGKIQVFENENVSFTEGGLSEDSFTSKSISVLSYNIGNNENRINGFYFAGGMLGYMSGGKIMPTCGFAGNATTVYAYNSSEYWLAVYAGGVVGYLESGEIGGNNSWQITGLNVYAGEERSVEVINACARDAVDKKEVSNIYVGGVSGYVGSKSNQEYGKITNIVLSNINVGGPYNVGGAVGLLENCGRIISVDNSNETLKLSNYKTEQNSYFKLKTSTLGTVNLNTYVGGIAAIVDDMVINPPDDEDAAIKNCKLLDSIQVNSEIELGENYYVYLGGIIGELEGGKVKKCSTTEIKDVSSGNTVSSVVGGIVGHMTNGSLLGNENINNSSVSSNFIAGGIVGWLTKGEIDSVKNNGSVSVSNSSVTGIAGGIIGVIICENNNNNNESNSVCKVVNCSNSKEVQSDKIAGGIVGYIYNSSESTGSGENAVSVNGNKNDSAGSVTGTLVAGGVVGYAYNKADDNSEVKIDANQNLATVNSKTNLVSGENVDKECFAGGVIGVGYNLQLLGHTSADNSGTVTGGYVTGGIAGYLVKSALKNGIKNNGAVSGGGVSGGVVGIIEGSSVDCNLENSENGILTNSINGIIGGVFGYANQVIISQGVVLENKADIGNNKTYVAGGVIGWANEINGGIVTNLKNSGRVTASGEIVATLYPSKYKEPNTTSIFVKTEVQSGQNNALFDTAKVSAGGIIGVVNKELTIYGLQTNGSNSISISSADYAGGIVGYTKANLTITNCENKLSVTGRVAGGIISEINNNSTLLTYKPEDESDTTEIVYGSIINSGNITSVDGENNSAGGIAGAMNGLDESFAGILYEDENGSTVDLRIKNTGSISAGKGGYAGGLVGKLNNGTISYGTNSGNVSATTEGTNLGSAGGLVGKLSGGTLSYTCSTTAGETSAPNGYAGGAVGYWGNGIFGNNTGEYEVDEQGSTDAGLEPIEPDLGQMVIKCVVNVTNGKYSGGLIGYQNCNNNLEGNVSGTVTGTDYAGGVAGFINGSGSVYAIAKGVTSISATGDDSYSGGLVGKLSGGTIFNGSGGKGISGTYSGGLVGTMTDGSKVQGGFGGRVTSGTYAGGIIGILTGGEITGGSGYTPSDASETAVVGSTAAGGIAGKMGGGSISGGASASGSVSASGSAGGIAGILSGGSTEIKGGKGADVRGGTNRGGIVGYMEDGKISGGIGGDVSSGGTNAGGVVGEMHGGAIGGGTVGGQVNGGTNAGGAVGFASGACTISVNTSHTPSGTNRGGIVGKVSASISIGSTYISGNGPNGIVGITSGGSICLLHDMSISGYTYAITSSNAIPIGGSSNITISTSSTLVDLNSGSLVNLTASSDSHATGAGIANTNSGTIYNCVNEGNVNSGGIVGTNTGTINKCKNNGEAVEGGIAKENNAGGIIADCENTADISGALKAGGIAGVNNGTIGGTNCKNSGRISTYSEESSAGGIAGENNGIIQDCTNSGTISGDFSGGIAGKSASGSKILDCKNSGYISGKSVGGVIGFNGGLVDKSNGTSGCTIAWSGSDNLYQAIGGVAGTNSGTIQNCTNSLSITSSARNVGGIVGDINTATGKIINCTNSGNITGNCDSGGNTRIGGIVGRLLGEGATGCTNTGDISYSYGLVDTGWSVDMFNTTNSTTSFSTDAFVGGIAGYAKNTSSVTGRNSGKIKNKVKVAYSDSSAEIKDYRGQIVGKVGDFVDGYSVKASKVKNTGGHTSEGFDGTPHGYIEGRDPYFAMFFKIAMTGIDITDLNPYDGNYDNPTYKIYASADNLDYLHEDHPNNTLLNRYLSQINGETNHPYMVSCVDTGLQEKSDTVSSEIYSLMSNLSSWDVHKSGGSVGSDSTMWAYKSGANGGLVTFVSNYVDIYKYNQERHFSIISSHEWAYAYDYTGNDYFGVIVLVHIQEYDEIQDTQQVSANLGIQDVGGYVKDTDTDPADVDYEVIQQENGYKVLAIKALYELCGPCGGAVNGFSPEGNSKEDLSGVSAPSVSGSGISEVAVSFAGGVGLGYGGGGDDIVEVALSQWEIRDQTAGGYPYWSYMGWNGRVAWCACFVSWCANQCGYVPDLIRKSAECNSFISINNGYHSTYIAANQFYSNGVLCHDILAVEPTIQRGDIIFFDWNDGGRNGRADHIGIVESVDANCIHTIEGNSGDMVKKIDYYRNGDYLRKYGYYSIMGFLRPEYPASSGSVDSVVLTGDYAVKEASIDSAQGSEFGKDLAKTALRIMQKGGAQYSEKNNPLGDGKYYYNYYSSRPGENNKDGCRYYTRYAYTDESGAERGYIYWYTPDVVKRIMNGESWTSDRCGFIRLCLALKGKSLGIYPSCNYSNARELQPGDLVFNRDDNILMVLYVDGDNICLIDQLGIKTGTISNPSQTQTVVTVSGKVYKLFYHFSEWFILKIFNIVI